LARVSVQNPIVFGRMLASAYLKKLLIVNYSATILSVLKS